MNIFIFVYFFCYKDVYMDLVEFLGDECFLNVINLRVESFLLSMIFNFLSFFVFLFIGRF